MEKYLKSRNNVSNLPVKFKFVVVAHSKDASYGKHCYNNTDMKILTTFDS